MKWPLISPAPPKLSRMSKQLEQIEARAIYSNGGPVVRQFERRITDMLFGGRGDTLAVSNATLGLMIAIRHAAAARARSGGLALVPSFTFAATAQAVQWAGLTPVLYDIDPDRWQADPQIEEALLTRLGERVAVIVPYATFGSCIDLDHYARLSDRHGVGIVVDAAASLGTLTEDGLNFGAGAPFPIVYSMHATKTFSTAEGGLIHSGDAETVRALRMMSNFGFGAQRVAEMPGLNAKLSETVGLLADAKLSEIDGVCDHRAGLEAVYRSELSDFTMQQVTAKRQAQQFFPLLLPPNIARRRADLVGLLALKSIGAGHYFSPHLAQQDYFRETCLIEPAPVADAVGGRILSLPITDQMGEQDVRNICDRLREAIAPIGFLSGARSRDGETPRIHETILIGGGPAGTAVLTAASKTGDLARLAEGLVIVERGHQLGSGRIGNYVINSDSTAETFLTAVKENPHEELAALTRHPAGHAIARYTGKLGAPLVDASDLLRETGTRLGAIVERHGGSVLLGHEALSARRQKNGLWQVTVRDESGAMRVLTARSIVVATGGYQSDVDVMRQQVCGRTLEEWGMERVMRSDLLLSHGGLAELRARLAGRPSPRIAIVGGSTSAIACAVTLLKADPALPFGADGLTLLHRRPLRPFYPSADAARADGFSDFTDADICPLSGFVYRLGGFRLEARELVLRILGINGRAPDPRLAARQIVGDSAADLAILAEADVIVAATGYRPHALPLLQIDGRPIRLACERAGAAMVDRQCRLVDDRGRPIAGLFGIGLAAGFRPSGALGGEASFRGQANGLWLWQNAIGSMIVDQLLAEPSTAHAVA